MASEHAAQGVCEKVNEQSWVQPITKVDVQNQTSGAYIKFLDYHDWIGKGVKGGTYPDKILKGGDVAFEHDGNGSGIDKGAVVYAASNQLDSESLNCAFLVAWCATSFTNPNQVYVQDGAIGDFLDIDWNDIEAKLNRSTTTSTAVDQTNKCKAVVMIDKNGNKATVSGIFTNIV